jgi:hypothetical protein
MRSASLNVDEATVSFSFAVKKKPLLDSSDQVFFELLKILLKGFTGHYKRD